MQVPIPLLSRPVGFGELVTKVLSAVFGTSPCNTCQNRSAELDKLLTFKEWSNDQ